MKDVVFIVNPNAANGAARKLWPGIAAKAQQRLGATRTLFTERQGHAIALARQAAQEGAGLVVSVGGDGTMNEVVNGLMNDDGTPVNPETAMGQISIGTGGDFRKTTGLPKEPDAALDWLVGESTKPIDVGRLRMIDGDGNQAVRFFINITSAGIGGEADDRVNRTTKAFGGFVSFFWGVLTAMVGYRNKPVHIVLDDERDLGVRIVFSIAVANGQFFGGGMHMAPAADLADGLFDVVIIGDLNWREKLFKLPKVYSANHLGLAKVESYRARKVVLTSDETVLLDVDGEQPGRLPTTFDLFPSALRFKVKGD